jgi:hypothetical protein
MKNLNIIFPKKNSVLLMVLALTTLSSVAEVTKHSWSEISRVSEYELEASLLLGKVNVWKVPSNKEVSAVFALSIPSSSNAQGFKSLFGLNTDGYGDSAEVSFSLPINILDLKGVESSLMIYKSINDPLYYSSYLK